jgi:hypothetical protein
MRRAAGLAETDVQASVGGPQRPGGLTEKGRTDGGGSLANLTRLLRAKPGSKVNPAEDSGPGYRTGFLKNIDGFGSPRGGQTQFVRARRRRRAGLLVLLITTAGIVLGVLMPRIHA